MRLEILSWILSAFAFMATAYIVPGFKVKGFFAALLAAIVLAIANGLLFRLLFILTFPITLLSLGLFVFVLDGLMIKIAAAFVPGFEVDGWWSAIFGAILLTFFIVVFHWLAGIPTPA